MNVRKRILIVDDDEQVLFVLVRPAHNRSADAGYGWCGTKRVGVYRCLDKPVEIGEIRQVVRRALEGAESGDPALSSGQ